MKREIESFQLYPSYYDETFLNGNKSHLVSELTALAICSLPVFLNVFNDLSKEVRHYFIKNNRLR